MANTPLTPGRYIATSLAVLALAVGGGTFARHFLQPSAPYTRGPRVPHGLRSASVDRALLRILHGSFPVATGTLTGSKGQAVTTTRAGSKTCNAGTPTAPALVMLSANQPCVESRGYLPETASTNLLLWSNNLGSAGSWSQAHDGSVDPGALTITANSCTAPDGTLTGTTVAFPASGSPQANRALIYQAMSFTSGATYAMSAYVKVLSGTGTSIDQLLNYASTVSGSLCTGLTTTAFTRCLAVGTAGATTGYYFIGYDSSQDTSNPGPFPAVTLCIADAQLEQQSFSSTYIPTTTTAAARVADLSYAVNPLPNSSAPWCVFETITPESGRPWNSGTAAAWELNAHQAANSAYSQISDDTNVYTWVYDSTATSAYGFAGNAFGNGSTHRLGQCLSGSTVTEYFDGVAQTVTQGGSGARSMTAQAGSFYIGSVSTGLQANAYISDVCVGAPGACR